MADLFDDVTSRGRLVRAWHAVADAGGVAGADGVTLDDWSWDWEERIARLAADVRGRRYAPSGLRRSPVPKPAGGYRVLTIATVTDRILQRAVHDVLEARLDDRFADGSFGYRPGRGVVDAVGRVAALRGRGYRWVVDADIADFFGSIPHDPLLARLLDWTDDPALVDLVRLWLASAADDAGTPDRGLPLGLPVCPILSNVYLDALDRAVEDLGWPIVRYADDFCLFDRRARGAELALRHARDALAALQLALNPAKTTVTTFATGFVFLGIAFDLHGQRVPIKDRWEPLALDDRRWEGYVPPGY